MKTRLCKLLMVSLVAVLALGTTGCTKEYYTDEYITEEYYVDETYITGSRVVTIPYEVKKAEWIWNDTYHRYECTKTVSKIDEALYETGTVVGTIYIMEDDGTGNFFEVQKTMPFVQTYKDLAVPYTEMISFDIFYGTTSSVTFYVQASDGSDVTPVLLDTYYFKLALIWDSNE
ncbi:MAG: hypothetical protein ACK5M3_00970 [Dysgonomonas sp.]